MSKTVRIILAGLSMAAACGCESASPPGRGRRAARKSTATAPAAASRPAPATEPAARSPATAPAPATKPAASRPLPPPAVSFDAALANVHALMERTEFFEAMKACRDVRIALPEHARAGELSALMRRLKEFRRDSPRIADAARKLASADTTEQRVAAAAIAEAGELGAIHLRKLLREQTGALAGEAARLLGSMRDPKAPPLLLAKLESARAPADRAVLWEALGALIEQTDADVFRRAYALLTAGPEIGRIDWLEYLAAALVQRCGGSAAKLDELLDAPGAFAGLKEAARAAAASKDPETAARAASLIAPFGLGVAHADCLLWLQAGAGITADAEGRVQRWSDLSGRGHHAAQEDAAKRPALSARQPGEPPALRFDGTDDFLQMPPGFRDFSKGVTVAVWACPTSTGSWARFLDLGNGDADDNVVFSRNATSADLCFQVYVGKQMGQTNAKGAIEQDRWQHFAATQDARGSVAFYKDGKQVATAKLPVRKGAVVRKLNYVARSNWGQDAWYKGFMDEIRVYRRALSAEEIGTIYRRTRHGREAR